MDDSKARKLLGQLDRDLSAFESISEWPDLNSWLSKLAKSVSSLKGLDSRFPCRGLLSKRLSQCLNPGLPNGIHRRTIEIYDLLFTAMGRAALIEDYHVYAVGLFPFFEIAKTETRSDVLKLYGNHLIPLCEVEPGYSLSLVMSLLPGLEELGTEHASSILTLFNRLRAILGLEYFYQTIWSAVINCSRHRLAALNFLSQDLPLSVGKSLNVADATMTIFSSHQDLVSKAIAVSIEDKSSLVARSALDILVSYLPADSCPIESSHMIPIIEAALQIQTRRDMALTRRFYNWVMASSTRTDSESTPGTKAIDLVVGAIVEQISRFMDSVDEDAIRPFKQLVFLCEKETISKPVIQQTFMELIRLAITVSQWPKPMREKFFGLVDLNQAWSIVLNQLSADGVVHSTDPGSIFYAINHLAICDEEALQAQVPVFLYILVERLSSSLDKHWVRNHDVIRLVIDLASRLREVTFPSGRSSPAVEDLAKAEVIQFNDFSVLKDELFENILILLTTTIDQVKLECLEQHLAEVYRLYSSMWASIPEKTDLWLQALSKYALSTDSPDSFISLTNLYSIIMKLIDIPVDQELLQLLLEKGWNILMLESSASMTSCRLMKALWKLGPVEFDRFLSIQVLSSLRSLKMLAECMRMDCNTIFSRLLVSIISKSHRIPSHTLIATTDRLANSLEIDDSLRLFGLSSIYQNAELVMSPFFVLLIELCPEKQIECDLVQIQYTLDSLLFLAIELVLKMGGSFDGSTLAPHLEAMRMASPEGSLLRNFSFEGDLEHLPSVLIQNVFSVVNKLDAGVEGFSNALASIARLMATLLAIRFRTGVDEDAIERYFGLLSSRFSLKDALPILEFAVQLSQHFRGSQGALSIKFSDYCLYALSHAADPVEISRFCFIYIKLLGDVPNSWMVLLKSLSESLNVSGHSDEGMRMRISCTISGLMNLFDRDDVTVGFSEFYSSSQTLVDIIMITFASIQTYLQSPNDHVKKILLSLFISHPRKILSAFLSWWIRVDQSAGANATMVENCTRLFIEHDPNLFISNISSVLSRVNGKGFSQTEKEFVPSLANFLCIFVDPYLTSQQMSDLSQFSIAILKEGLTMAIRNKQHLSHLLGLLADTIFAACSLSPKPSWIGSRDFMDMAFRYFELSIAVATKMLDSNAWKKSTIGLVPRDSEDIYFLLPLASDVSSFKSLNFCSLNVPQLVAILENVDSDRSTSIGSQLFTQLILPFLRNSAQSEIFGYVGSFALASFTSIKSCNRLWRKDLWDLYWDRPFAAFGKPSLRIILHLIGLCSDEDRIEDAIARSSQSGANSLFQSRETEQLTRKESLRRLIFVFLAAPSTALVSRKAVIQRRVVEYFRDNSSSDSLADIFLLCRTLLLKFGSDFTTHLGVSSTVEAIECVSTTWKAAIEDPIKLKLSLQALKFLELLYLDPIASVSLSSSAPSKINKSFLGFKVDPQTLSNDNFSSSSSLQTFIGLTKFESIGQLGSSLCSFNFGTKTFNMVELEEDVYSDLLLLA